MSASASGDSSPSYQPPSVRWRWVIRLLAVAGGAIAFYLLYVSIRETGGPLGCGKGSSCEKVIASRWAKVMGLPVAAPALLTYCGVFAASFFISPRRLPEEQRAGWAALLVAAAAVFSAAAYFVVLQVLYVKAVCPWCMTDHVLGVLLAGLIFLKAPLRSQAPIAESSVDPKEGGQSQENAEPSNDTLPPIRDRWGETVEIAPPRARKIGFGWFGGAGLILLGAMFTAGIAVEQAISPYQGLEVRRLPPGKNTDTGPGPERVFSILDGEFEIEPHQQPMVGDPDAPHLLVILFDYRCPHCRSTHGYLRQAMKRYPNQIGIVAWPSPLNKDCNKHVRVTESRFEESCDVARLTLAVWYADRAAFPNFDAWLFESESPPTLESARRKAAELVGEKTLAQAIDDYDSEIEKRISRNADAQFLSGDRVLPLIMSPEFPGVEGRPESKEYVFEILENELGLKPSE